MTRRPRTAAAALALTLATAVLAGCSSDAEAPETDEPSTTHTPEAASPSSASMDPSESAYLPVPDAVELTAPGTELGLGEPAVVAWQPTQKVVGALSVAVKRLELTSFKQSFTGWQLEGPVPEAAPYFVRVKLENVGETDLGGHAIPLYAVDGNNALVEYSTFEGPFKPCDSKGFPTAFPPGETVTRCLVYLVPAGGALTAVSFRPTQEFDPITWTGQVRDLTKGKRSKQGKKSGG